MRIRFVLALVALSGVICATGCKSDNDPAPAPPEEGSAISEDDAAVIKTAIGHFSTQDFDFPFIGREAQTGILVHRESAGGPWAKSLTDEVLSNATKWDNWTVPAEASESLRRRNAEKASLSGLELSEGIILVDLYAKPRIVFGDNRDPKDWPPNTKGFAHVWLPGYTADGRTAVVHFDFGPSEHGASATYLLTKGVGGWMVQKWSFVYYV
ncbi:MAG TPA: hypothetical protein VHR66_09820 [Gemmataceae bacterium]|jgi:hypothetical protein|nr:hypothetical protein [Gemmataceae bacterium]